MSRYTLSTGRDIRAMNAIDLPRLFPGWDGINQHYHRPGCDGSITLFIDREAYNDEKDARLILDYLLRRGAFGIERALGVEDE